MVYKSIFFFTFRAYLSRSLSRLFDPVNLMFSAGEVPTEVELHQVSNRLLYVLRTIKNEQQFKNYH